MFTPAPALWVDAHQAQRLKSLVASGRTPQKIVLRARIILLAGEGMPNHAIAARVGASRPTVLLWRGRFQRSGVPGLMKDARRPGRKKVVAPEVIQRVVDATLHTTPAGRDALERAEHGQGPGALTHDCAADLETTPAAAPPGRDLQVSRRIRSSSRNCAMWWGCI